MQHFRGTHMAAKDSLTVVHADAFEQRLSRSAKHLMCLFCGYVSGTWTERVGHVANNFENGEVFNQEHLA